MPEFKSQTDKTLQAKLKSSIQQIFWNKRAVIAGRTTELEVFTHHVGNNWKLI